MISYDDYAKLRDLRGLKDAFVAQKAGFGRSTFSDWKSGRSTPKTDKLQKIADVLGIPYTTMLNLDEQPAEVPQYNPRIQDFIDILPKLTDEQIDSLLRTAQLFVSMNGG